MRINAYFRPARSCFSGNNVIEQASNCATARERGRPIFLVTRPDVEFGTLGLVVVERATPEEIISQRGVYSATAGLAIVDMLSASKRDVIVCSLLLRNGGWIVIVTDLNRAPTDLVAELHDFACAATQAGQAVRTEVVLTEEAMDAFGDISAIVNYFEREFLR